jgi:hypothetical protein
MEIPQTISEKAGDLDELAWLKSAFENSPFDFLREEPDIYHSTDGKPFNAETEFAC